MHALLTEAFSIPSRVWWRDDLDARLDNAPNVKWSYPQILNAADVLTLLLQRHNDPADQQSARTLRTFFMAQYDRDRDVKFKQVELQQTLTAVFIDLPLAEKCQSDELTRRQRVARPGVPPEINAYLDHLDSRRASARPRSTSHSGLAAAFFLQMPLAPGVCRFVLEGAPGQGKSTVTQFLCQSHRLRLLGKDPELQRVQAHHKTGPMRAPFRIDLRDYAAWLNGRHPFAKKGEDPVPEDGRRSLESFIAMQTPWDAGNLPMTQNQLLSFLEHSHAVIILDGFDEVADIAARARLVEEISSASTRLDVNARSLQIIVTSRPAAFANSPGFPESQWVHLELRDLRDENIRAYTEKWILSQRLSAKQAVAVSGTLEDKLEQPHMRDLARNPMQLAILLHLIHVQGVALPEKRTALYEEYMKIFFNREAEKSPIVLDRRDLILSIHGMLAWVLQIQAEDGSGSGSLTEDDLRLHTKHFLETEEHDVSLVDALFAGAFERVGALVSRVQGTYEFEVQPLREYFAARHLYKTSPYSPPGRVQKGTRPERFDALARNAYWTNVTRFFCGFYDVGELGTLVDGLLQLNEEEDYNLINKPRQLVMMLLADHVFSQSPREMKRLIRFITEEPGFARFGASLMPPRWRDTSLPEMAGRPFLFAACSERLQGEADGARRRLLGTVMRANAERSALKEIWQQRHVGSVTIDDLREAMALGIIDCFDVSEIEALTRHDDDLRCRWLLWADRQDQVAKDESLYPRACAALFNERLFFPPRSSEDVDAVVALEILTDVLNVDVLATLLAAEDSDGDTGYSAVWTADRRQHEEQLRRLHELKGNRCATLLVQYAAFVVDQLDKEAADWRTTLEPWSLVTDGGFAIAAEIAVESSLFEQIAMISTAVRTEGEAGEWSVDGFRRTKGLARRLHYARRRAGDLAWWQREWNHAGNSDRVLCMATLLLWGEPKVLLGLRGDCSEKMKRLDSTDWQRLWSLLRRGRRAATSLLSGLDQAWFDRAGELDPRMALAIVERVEDERERRRLTRRLFGVYEGTDQFILWYVANCENVDGGWSDVDWKFVSHLSMRAKRAGIEGLLGLRADGSHTVEIPKDVAVDVLHNCGRHCTQFVALCEHAYSMALAKTARKVAELAEEDEWFAPHS